MPQLRFAEFRGDGDWSVILLENLAKVVASGDLDPDLYSPTKTNEYFYPVYSNSIDKEGLYGFYSCSKFPGGSVTITARGTLGVAFYRKQDFMGIGRLIVVSNFKEVIPEYFKEIWNHLITAPEEITSIPQLTAVTARATPIPVPDMKEQQKIADCLSALDDRIAAQADKIDALKAHKKGLLQQLFPAMEEVGT